MLFHTSVYDGHITKGFSQLTALASCVIERWYVAPGVRRVTVQERGVQGTLFIPPGMKTHMATGQRPVTPVRRYCIHNQLYPAAWVQIVFLPVYKTFYLQSVYQPFYVL